MDGCPSPAELAEFSLGRMPRPRSHAIGEHLELCSRCEASLQELDRVEDPLVAALSGTAAAEASTVPLPPHLLELARSAGGSRPTKLGRFEFVGELGSGSYGTVFKARDPQLGRTVAIKMLRTSQLGGPEELDRFLREARSFAQVSHPGIVTLYEIGQDEGRCYLVEEYVEGVTLAARMAEKPLPFREAAELLSRVCEALHVAHRQGVIHRDIKPSNILLGRDGRPRLADFGLAKVEGDEKPVTQDGQILGTPAYMSPEQARGESSRVDARTDVYSLGVILYELLTQERPFQGNRRMLILQVLEDEPRPPRQLGDKIPRDLETICLKAMAKTPALRYATAQDMADDLKRFLDGEPIKARPLTVAERLMRWTRRRPAAAALVTVSFLATALLAGLFSVSYVRIARERAEAEKAKEAYRKALLHSARLTSESLKEANEYYSEVISRLTDRTIQFTHEYAQKKNAIPLPATMSVELGDRISRKTGMQTRLFSDFAFPWRRQEGGPRDPFQREALKTLRSDPLRPFYEFSDLNGRPSLRYATASRMEKKCVDCHNHHPDSPKKDWKEGDVVGVYEVSFPVDMNEP